MWRRIIGYLGILKEGVLLKLYPSRDRRVILNRIAARLGSLQGIPQKVGQLIGLSEITDEDPLFLALAEQPGRISSEVILKRVDQELRLSSGDYFSSFEERGREASIGQVHQAVLRSGKKVAVKVQIPKIAEAIRSDLMILGWAFQFRKGYDRAAYQAEVGRMIAGELDYRREANWLRAFMVFRNQEGKRGAPWLQIPEVIEGTERLLIMEWMEGVGMQEVLTWTERERKTIAERLIRLFFLQIFSWGVIHADPNLGNYRFNREDLSIQLFDFGCVKEINPKLQREWAMLLSLSKKPLPADEFVFESFVKIGFRGESLMPFRDRLAALTALILEPFQSEGDYDWREWRLTSRSDALLGEHRLAFRSSGPPEILYWIRSFQGLSATIIGLGVTVNARSLIKDLVTNSIAIGSEDKRESILRMEEEVMRIEVTEKGEKRVSLTYEASASEHLSQLMPREWRDRVRERGIDLAAVERKAKAGGFAPGELFHWTEGEKEVKVWIE